MRTEMFHRHHSNSVTTPQLPPRPPPAQVTPAIFSESVYAEAEENCAKIMARRHKRIEEPRLLAQAIRDSYAVSPLVRTLQTILQELSEERGTRLGFGFSGPTGLVLTQDGFYVTQPTDAEEVDVLVLSPLPQSLDVGPDGTCAMARLQLDSQLTQFAQTPEVYAMPAMDKPKFDDKKEAKLKSLGGGRKPRRKPRRGLAGVPLLGKLFR